MADYAIVKSSTLHGIADAIIAKGGSAGSLLPSAMPGAIAAIQTTATVTTVEVPEKHVNFYDYDGKRLYSYTWEEARSLNELPPLPTRDGMVCTGWNWTSDKLKSMVSTLFPAVEPDAGLNREGIVDVGALYIPASGATELCVGFDDGDEHEFIFTFTPSSGANVTVRMGDESSSGTGDGTLIEWRRRFTAGAGEWKTISITVTHGTCVFNGVDSPKDLREIRFGDNMTGLGAGALRDCTRLTFASFTPLTSAHSGGYQLCNTGLECVILPRAILSLPSHFLSMNPRLRVLSLGAFHQGTASVFQFTDPRHIAYSSNPESRGVPSYRYQYSFVTRIHAPDTFLVGSNAFIYCTRLEEIQVPQLVLDTPQNAFFGCSRLRELPPITALDPLPSGVFAGCRSLTSLKFKLAPENDTSLALNGDGIFAGCESLTSLDFTDIPYAVPVSSTVFSITNISDSGYFAPNPDVYPGVNAVISGLPTKTVNVYVRAEDVTAWEAEWSEHIDNEIVQIVGV